MLLKFLVYQTGGWSKGTLIQVLDLHKFLVYQTGGLTEGVAYS